MRPIKFRIKNSGYAAMFPDGSIDGDTFMSLKIDAKFETLNKYFDPKTDLYPWQWKNLNETWNRLKKEGVKIVKVKLVIDER